MCKTCYSNEYKKIQTLLFKGEVSESLKVLAEVYKTQHERSKLDTESDDQEVNEISEVDDVDEDDSSGDEDDDVDDDDEDDDNGHDNDNDQNSKQSSNDSENFDQANLSDDYEILKNAKIGEKAFLTIDLIVPKDENDAKDTTPSSPSSSFNMHRQTSDGFYRLSTYEEITDIDDLINFTDKNGNTSLHYLCSMGLEKSAALMISLGASEWRPNKTFDTPRGLLDGLPLGDTPIEKNKLHTALAKRELVSAKIMKAALRCPFDYSNNHNSEILQLLTSMKSGNEDDAAYYADEAVQKNIPHSLLYRALFRLEFKYGSELAKRDLKSYLDTVNESNAMILDPSYFYAEYRLWKDTPGRPSHLKTDQLRAYDALSALKLFPSINNVWIDDMVLLLLLLLLLSYCYN